MEYTHLVNDLYYAPTDGEPETLRLYLKEGETYRDLKVTTGIREVSPEDVIKTKFSQLLLFEHIIVPNIMAYKQINSNTDMKSMMETIENGYADTIVDFGSHTSENYNVLVRFIDRGIGDKIRSMSMKIIEMDKALERTTLYAISYLSCMLSYTGHVVYEDTIKQKDTLLDGIEESHLLVCANRTDARNICDVLNNNLSSDRSKCDESTNQIIKNMLAEQHNDRLLNYEQSQQTQYLSAKLLYANAVVENNIEYVEKPLEIVYSSDASQSVNDRISELITTSLMAIVSDNNNPTTASAIESLFVMEIK